MTYSDDVRTTFANIEAVRQSVSPSQPYKQLAELLDRQEALAAAHASGGRPARPNLTLIVGGKE